MTGRTGIRDRGHAGYPNLKITEPKDTRDQSSGVRAVGVSRHPEKTLPFPCGKVIYPIRLSADRG